MARNFPPRLTALGASDGTPGSGRSVNVSPLSLSEPSLQHAKDDRRQLESRCRLRPSGPLGGPRQSPASPGSDADPLALEPAAHLRRSPAPRPNCKARPGRPRSAAVGEPGPLGPPLSVVGKPCVLNCNRRPSTGPSRPFTGPSRPRLHVFLPTEAAEEEETDAKSTNDIAMDDLEAKMASLRQSDADGDCIS